MLSQEPAPCRSLKSRDSSSALRLPIRFIHANRGFSRISASRLSITWNKALRSEPRIRRIGHLYLPVLLFGLGAFSRASPLPVPEIEGLIFRSALAESCYSSESWFLPDFGLSPIHYKEQSPPKRTTNPTNRTFILACPFRVAGIGHKQPTKARRVGTIQQSRYCFGLCRPFGP